jgi:hypothetical protein
MGTGGTTDARTRLAFQWDGQRIQWVLGTGRTLTKAGEEPAHGVEQFIQACKDLKNRGLQAEVVVWGLRHPDFALLPGSASGGAMGAWKLLYGEVPAGCAVRSFVVDGPEGTWVMAEAHKEAIAQAVVDVWPQARLESPTLRFIEAAGRQEWGHRESVLYLDVAQGRALGVRFDRGGLKWAMPVQDIAGEGLLYAAVNAMHRDGVAPGEVEVVWSGEVVRDDALWTAFLQFFPRTGMLTAFHPIEWGPEGLREQRWAGVANLWACA